MPFTLPTFMPPNPPKLVLGRTGPWSVFPTFGLAPQQRTGHMHVLGIIGQGKSKLLENCLVQDILAGRGCGLIDPHSDLARDVLWNLADRGFFDREENRNRLIYFEPGRDDYLLPFNILATSDKPHTVALNIIEAFRRSWPTSLTEAPRFTDLMTASIMVLIANKQTLMEIPQFLTDKPFREQLLKNVSDPELLRTFHQRFDRWGKEQPVMIESVLNKLSAFTYNANLKLMLGQQENALNFRSIMDEGKVFIANLGSCDYQTQRLLGSLLTTGFERAAFSRSDEETNQRRPFYLYIDEFQDFSATEGSTVTLSRILSNSRKFGLFLVLAHQNLGQMRSSQIQVALQNIKSHVVFGVDRDDAEVMARKLLDISSENVKHTVENEEAEEKTHPVFYSLTEEREKATQMIKNLPPRTALVTTPTMRPHLWLGQPALRQVVKIHTITVPSHRLPIEAFKSVRLSLVKQICKPMAYLKQAVEARQNKDKRGGEPTGFYEPKPGSQSATNHTNLRLSLG